ncbi:MAG: hypothetical protein AB1465_02950 [Patescibacteria group bacterium]
MGKITFLIILIFGITAGSLVFAHGNNFTETKQLIESGISCDKLTDEQLEAIGDYYMEQMHPGEAHEMMDKMMGGEGSENLKQMHINMAKRLYCNENIDGMMEGGENMMNMMNMMGQTQGQGMMSGFWCPMLGAGGWSGFWGWTWMLLGLAIVVLIIILLVVLIIRLTKK